MMYSSQWGTDVESPCRNSALVFLTIHEQPFLLPYYCVIRNFQRLASLSFFLISSFTRSALDVPHGMTDSSTRTPLRAVPNTLCHFLHAAHFTTASPHNSIHRRLTFYINSIDYVMHQQFNIQQLYALPTLYLCVLYLSQNKQRLVPLTA